MQIVIKVRSSVEQAPFRKDLFISQLIFDFNQALNDTKVELQLYKQTLFPREPLSKFQDELQKLVQLLKANRAIRSQTSTSKKQKIQATNQRSFQQGFVVGLVKELQEFVHREVANHLKMLSMCIQDRSDLLHAFMTFQVVYNLTLDAQVVKTLVLNVPLTKVLDEGRIKALYEKHVLAVATE